MVVETARRNDLLLRTDLSYRHTKAMLAIRKYVQEGAIGAVFSADLVFHNAYGPDKPWFYDARLSGGGSVMDLGIHLVDLLLWTLGFPRVEAVTADLFTNGTRLSLPTDEVEDFAVAQLGLDDGATARLTCSWNLHAGQDAVISATFHGTEGALRFANVGGSFYDFTAELLKGTTREVLVEPPDEWGGRAAIQWAQRLAVSNKFDPEAERLVAVSSVLDRIYGR
jgi:predicted dehydrogenase